MLEKMCSPVVLIILHLSYGSTGLLDRSRDSDRSSGPGAFGTGRAPKKSPFGNGPKEGLGLVCRWTRKDHVIGKLSSFFKSKH